MLRCPQCGSEDEFEVDELAHQIIRVRSMHDYEYAYVDTVETYDVTWGMVRCLACQHQTDEQEAKDAYMEAREKESVDEPAD